MENIVETLNKLASSLETLANSIEEDSKVANSQVKVASENQDFGFGNLSDKSDRSDPLMSFILS